MDVLRYSDFVGRHISGSLLAYRNRLREPDYFEMFERCGLPPVWHERTLLQPDLDALRALRVDRKFARYLADQNAAPELSVSLVRAI